MRITLPNLKRNQTRNIFLEQNLYKSVLTFTIMRTHLLTIFMSIPKVWIIIRNELNVIFHISLPVINEKISPLMQIKYLRSIIADYASFWEKKIDIMHMYNQSCFATGNKFWKWKKKPNKTNKISINNTFPKKILEETIKLLNN